MASNAERRARHMKLYNGFLMQEFLPMVVAEVEKFGEKYGLKLGVDFNGDSWSIITSTPTTYDQGGYYTDDSQETITKVRVFVRIKIDGEARGSEQPIEYSPEFGFSGIENAVKVAAHAAPAEQPDNDTRAGLLQLDRILNTSYAFEHVPTPEAEPELDDRLIAVIEAMKTMGVPRKHAVECGEAVIKTNPDCHDTDDLLKMAMEYYEKTNL